MIPDGARKLAWNRQLRICWIIGVKPCKETVDDYYKNTVPYVFFGGGTDMESFLKSMVAQSSLQLLINTVM